MSTQINVFDLQRKVRRARGVLRLTRLYMDHLINSRYSGESKEERNEIIEENDSLFSDVVDCIDCTGDFLRELKRGGSMAIIPKEEMRRLEQTPPPA